MNPRPASSRVRLHKHIARSGIVSRRGAEAWIAAGRVRVNGEVVTEPGTTIDPDRDEVSVDGQPIAFPAALTIALHKPRGVVTTMRDPQNRPTVLDLLPRGVVERGVRPAGRLDLDTEGLLLLTNDGALLHRLTHPRFETEKEYLAEVSGDPREDALERLRRGISIDGRLTAPAIVERAGNTPHGASCRVVLHEGRKRQVRRMFEAIGHPVLRLVRVRIGSIELGDLAPGSHRPLSAEEIASLRGER